MRRHHNLTNGLISGTILASMALLMMPSRALALSGSGFNPARIIDDSIFFNSNTMNTGDIQNFLNSKVPSCDTNGSLPKNGVSGQTRAQWAAATGNPAPPYICLRNYSQSFSSVGADAYCGAISGGNKSAADIIFNVARACNVNPQALIVLLQKEQALVTDDWPWPVQYRSATGYGCPDTAACDSQYYGFFNQVYNAGHQFQRYVKLPHLFNYAAGRTSFILYNPSSSCGGTNVTIQNGATAALYNYTPYQPNASALNNLYGSGDSCGAYGNRNFWRMFNDWFGPTLADGYTLALNETDNTQWVIFRGVRQYVPSGEIKRAWGLPDAAVPMSADYLATIPSGPALGRLFHLIGSPDLYFADGGKKYYVGSQQVIDAWGGFPGEINTYVSYGLWALPQSGGSLTYSVKNASSPALYMVDGLNSSGQIMLRQYNDSNVYHAWEGEVDTYTTLSDDYFNSIDNAIGSSLTTTKIVYGGSEYQVIAGQRMPQSVAVAPLYPGVAQAVSSQTFNRLAQTSPATHLVRSATSPSVYLVDGGTKHHILSSNVLSSWSASGQPINIVNNGFVDLLSTGVSISNYLADVSGQLYVIDVNKITVPSGLDSAYRNSGTVYSASTTLANLFTTASSPATGFVKGNTAPQVHLLDNSGKRRHLEWADKVTLWGGYQAGITVLSDYVVNSISSAPSPSIFVSDGTSEYVMEGGQKVSVGSSIKTNWGLSGAQVFSDGTLDRFASGGALDNKLKNGNLYYLIRDGVGFVTIDPNIANAWSIDTATSRDDRLVTALLPRYSLTRFVRSSVDGDNRTFVIDGGNWYYITSGQRTNLGSSNEPTMSLDPANAPNSITNWTSVVVKDSSGKHYVIDGATKRSFANSIIQNHWTGNGSLTVPTTTNGFLNLLPTAGTVERAIKGSAAAVYSADNGTKRWILSSTTYNQSYAPFVFVSDALINVLPSGTSIP